jgi:hypothetical protein
MNECHGKLLPVNEIISVDLSEGGNAFAYRGGVCKDGEFETIKTKVKFGTNVC